MTSPKDKLPLPLWWYIVVVSVVVFVLSIAGVLYTRHVDSQRERAEREADRRWCELFDFIRHQTVSSNNPQAARYMELIEDLYQKNGCSNG